MDTSGKREDLQTTGHPIESAADYPRPPRVEPTARHIKVVFNGQTVAETRRAVRLLETTHAPNYYIPAEDVHLDLLEANPHKTICEYKGEAVYHDVVVGDRRARQAVWSYPKPRAPYDDLADHYCFYVHPMDACVVDGEVARPEPIRFYGGWVTDDVKGPFAGER